MEVEKCLAWIKQGHPKLSISRQCELLNGESQPGVLPFTVETG